MLKEIVSILTISLALLHCTEVPAQVVWRHKTSDVWLSPLTHEVDSSICFTNLSCYGDNCTAAAILFNYPVNPVGRIAYYRSNDGGLSWFEQPHTIPNEPPDITNWGMHKVQQIDSLNFVAAGGIGTIDRTTDGGLTWRRTNPSVKLKFWNVHFSDPMTGIITCEGLDGNVQTTTDGGEHWQVHSFPPGVWGVSGHSYGKGKFSFFKYGHGPLYTTHDNFATIDSAIITYDTLGYPKSRIYITQLHYGSDDLIIGTGAYLAPDNMNTYALIVRSLDAGETWEKPWLFPTVVMSSISRVSSVDRDTIFAGGAVSRYLISTNRGKTWTVDTVLIDTNYIQSDLCLGMEICNNGNPIAIFGNGVARVSSLITRGEYLPASVEFIEGVRYYSRFYPNPTTGLVKIQSKDMGKSPVTVIDIFGRTVHQGNLSPEGKLTMDLSHLQPGLYNVVFDYMGIVFVAGRIILVH